MDTQLLEQLYAEEVISNSSYARLKLTNEKKLFSVHWEIKTLLYLGVLLLSGGLGTLVYKNIDTIGHQAILAFIALICGCSFYYCYRKKLPFSTQKVATPNAFFDYILLLACCTFITFVAYLQYQYNVFGDRYGAATFFPMIVLFFSAYYFDHSGILITAITNLGAWLGLTITPLHILESNDYNSNSVIFTGIFLGCLLIFIGWITNRKNIKKHFEFTYTNFGIHVLFISCLAAMFHFTPVYIVWFLLIAGICFLVYRKALKEKSFYYLLVVTLYGYIAVSYVFLELLDRVGGYGIGAVYIGFIYFIASGIGLILFLVNINKKIKAL